MNKYRLLKESILNTLKKLFEKEVVKRVLGGAVGGIQGWAVTIAASVFFNKVIRPAYDFVARKIFKLNKTIEVKRANNELNNAEDDDFDAAADNIK